MIERKYLRRYYDEEFKLDNCVAFNWASKHIIEDMQTTLHFKIWYLKVLGKEIIDNVKKLW